MPYKKIFILLVATIFLFAGTTYFFPNTNLTTTVVTIGTHKLSLFVANESHERVRGLMGIQSLRGNDGMLFLFEQSQEVTFWNKNLLLPLDVIWIRDGIVVGMDTLLPESVAGVKHIYSQGAVDSVIEVPEGWFFQNGVSVGDDVLYP